MLTPFNKLDNLLLRSMYVLSLIFTIANLFNTIL